MSTARVVNDPQHLSLMCDTDFVMAVSILLIKNFHADW